MDHNTWEEESDLIKLGITKQSLIEYKHSKSKNEILYGSLMEDEPECIL